ncbi:MAG: helix-turn-helix domain-containing protein, partial [Fuerstiella sp.]
DKKIHHIDPDALQLIEDHVWPGNIRELENAIERAVVLAETDTIALKDLPPQMIESAGKKTAVRKPRSTAKPSTAKPASAGPSSAGPASAGLNASRPSVAARSELTHRSEERDVARGVKLSEMQSPSAAAFAPVAVSPQDDGDEYLQLQRALELADGNKALAARSLKMPRSTFYSKLKKHQL